jgi:hypothetical protein
LIIPVHEAELGQSSKVFAHQVHLQRQETLPLPVHGSLHDSFWANWK